VRSILKFVFVAVPTAVLATAVVVGVSRSGQGATATSDGDLQRDLTLASATTLELAPAGQSLATVSSIEAPPPRTPERTIRPKRSRSGSRVVRSRAPVVRAAPEREVAESAEESEEATTELTGNMEATVEAPAAGGVALPRPSAIPVILPTAGGDAGTYDPGPGSVIRGGVLDGDHCQIHGRGRPVYGPPIYRQPRGISDRVRINPPSRERTTIADRVRRSETSGVSRGSSSIRDRIRTSQGGTSSGTSRGSWGDRIRARR
jgi:hypothetical protein